MPGRPATKKRRRSSEKETKFATARVKVSRTVRCGNCFEFGYNKQSCTSETKPRVPHAPKKIGRPRKNQEEHESATTKTPINQNVDPNQHLVLEERLEGVHKPVMSQINQLLKREK